MPKPQLSVLRNHDDIPVDSAATKLTDWIPGASTEGLVEILKEIAAEFGLLHISYVSLDPHKSPDWAMLSSVVTYSKEWQRRYFLKKYFHIDPVIAKGRHALLPFDWDDLTLEDPNAAEMFEDAIAHGVGRYGLSIPVKSRPNGRSVVSYTCDSSREAWERFKAANMVRLQQLSALIDTAARAAATTSKLPPPEARLSPSEEQCLIWAARGKTHHEIADISSFGPARVRSHLDTARHKLSCVNVTHAVAVAMARGIIPAAALRDSP